MEEMNMKKYIIILSVLALAGCSRETVPGTSFEGRVETVKASISATKVEISDAGKFSWTAGDRIAVHRSVNGYETATLSADGSFSIHLADGEARDCFAVYPAESADAAAFGESGLKVNLPSEYAISKYGMKDYSPLPMVAVNDPLSEDILFHHLGGILRLEFNEVPYETMKISVNVGKKVTGSFDVIDPLSSSPYIALAAGTAEDVVFNLSTPVTETANDFVINLPVPTGEYETLAVKFFDRYDNLIVENTQEIAVNVERADGYELSSDMTLDLTRLPVCLKMVRDGEVSVKASQTNPRTIQYSFDNVNWDSFSSDRTFSMQRGQTIYFRGQNSSYADAEQYGWVDESNCTQIRATAKCYLYGNIMSLINPDPDVFSTLDALPADNTFCYLFSSDEGWGSFSASICNHPTYDLLLPATTLSDRCYQYMFRNTGITRMELPATEMKPYCYYYMFSGCNKMVETPALPSTSMAKYCYGGMFDSCWLIKSAPELPATTLADYCYEYMFDDCKSLENAPELPVMELKHGCYNGMFSYCVSLKEAPELPAMTLVNSCYQGMFRGCEKLTTAPNLPATTLADYCYSYMFEDCSVLVNAPELPVMELKSGCYNGMFEECVSLTEAPELPATTLESNCYYSMFRNCENLAVAPVLPAATLAWGCYAQMFEGCTSLGYLKAMFTAFPENDSNHDCIRDWLKDVQSSGTYVMNSLATYNPVLDAQVPSGWTIQTASE